LNHFGAVHLAKLGEHLLKLRVVDAVAQIPYIKLLTHEKTPTKQSFLRTKSVPIELPGVETKGTSVVVRQVARRKRKCRPI
jgi:hypothetical protein